MLGSQQLMPGACKAKPVQFQLVVQNSFGQFEAKPDINTLVCSIVCSKARETKL